MDEEVPRQVVQGPPAPYVKDDMSNVKIRSALKPLTILMRTHAQVVTNHKAPQANQGVRPQPNVSTPASRIQDIMRMNPPTFHGTKVDEDT